jgi:hypothetical protein
MILSVLFRVQKNIRFFAKTWQAGFCFFRAGLTGFPKFVDFLLFSVFKICFD